LIDKAATNIHTQNQRSRGTSFFSMLYILSTFIEIELRDIILHFLGKICSIAIPLPHTSFSLPLIPWERFLELQLLEKSTKAIVLLGLIYLGLIKMSLQKLATSKQQCRLFLYHKQ